jgi:hypothetical protein
MGLYEDFQKTKKTSEGGLYGEFLKTKEPQQSTFSKVAGVTKSVGKGILDMFTNPAPAQQEYEKQVLPDYYKGDSKIMKYATAPGTAVARGALKTFSRLITPGLTPLTTDIAEIREVSKKGGIADKVASGELPASTLEDFKVLKKTSPQIVGDVAQAVLTFYGGSAAKNLASAGTKGAFKQSFIQGAKEMAPLGTLFGGATLASEGETDIKNIAKTLAISTATAGILGGIVKGTIPASAIVRNKVENLFAEKKIPVTRVKIESVPSTGGVPKINTPKSLYAEYRAKQGYEPYLQQSELPVIEMGAKRNPSSELPTIQIGEKTPKIKGDIIYEPINPIETIKKTSSTIVDKGTKSPEVVQSIAKEIPRVVPKQTEITGTTIVPKLSSDIEQNAIKKDLISHFEGLPEIQKMNMDEQTKGVSDLINSDYEKAKRIALGKENAPGNLENGSVFVGVRGKAAREGDVATLKALATESTVSSQATRMGQGIKSLDVKDSVDPVELMQSVAKARETGLEKRIKGTKSNTVKEIKDVVKKNLPKKEDWASFISQIEC